jgi:glutamate carboxypeptidase
MRANMQHYAPYLGWIDHQKEHMKETLIRWANINSHAMNLEGLTLQLNALKEQFSSLNGQMQELTLPPFQYIDAHGNSVSTPLGKALHITKRQNAKLRFFFSGHMDTVYGKNSSFQKVEQVSQERLVGPGVADMKGGLVILLTALEAFEKSPYAADVGLEILITPDEEIGSPGSKSILERAAKRNHFGFVFEPSFADGAFVSERGGSMNCTLVVRGKSAHAGRDFNEGRSAIYAIAPLIIALEKLNTPEAIVNVGTIAAGGHTANVVPDLAIAKVNLRAKEIEAMQTLKNAVQELVKKHNNREGITIELHEGICRMPKKMNAATE